MTGQRHPLVERVGYHAERLRAWARRATPTALLVRGAVWASGTAALVLAAPSTVHPVATVVVAVTVAGAAAAWPGSGVVAGLEIGAVALAALSAGQRGGLPPAEVWLLAALLYAHHTAAALAAHLRTDTLVPPALLGHWLRRTAVVLAVSTVVGAVVALAPVAAPTWPATWPVTWALLLGLTAALAVVATLVHLPRRRDPSAPSDPSA